MYKFSGGKYITAAVQNDVPVELQNRLWMMIETMLKKKGSLDYLQIFNLECSIKDGVRYQKITHSQEQPQFKYSVEYISDNIIADKIYIIDDVDHVTMLFSRDY